MPDIKSRPDRSPWLIGRGSAFVLGTVALAGCATLPSSGPTGAGIRKQLQSPSTPSSSAINIIEVADPASLPTLSAPVTTVLTDQAAPPTDMIGPGDVLDISIYESGVTLFGGSAKSDGESGSFDSSSKAGRLSAIRVDDQGEIEIPYGGRLHVAGETLREVNSKIRESLRGYSQNPQVYATLRDAITNSVIIGGEVTRPGRLVLRTNLESLTDAIALAGGYRGDSKDLAVLIERRGQSEEFRLSDAITGARKNLRVYPGDRISVIQSPQSFSVMGAPGAVQLYRFPSVQPTLIEAIAEAGGSNPNFGDPKAIFVFRYVVNEKGSSTPVVYHINMMNAGNYLLAQRFMMRDKDVVYVGNAQANQPSKLIQIVSQLFSPIVTVTSAAQVLKN